MLLSRPDLRNPPTQRTKGSAVCDLPRRPRCLSFAQPPRRPWPLIGNPLCVPSHTCINMKLGDAWSSVRGLIRSSFSFAQIKDLVGAAGLSVFKLAHLQQKFSGGASKGQLMDGIDGLVAELDVDDRARFMTSLLREAVSRKEELRPQIEELLATAGWGLVGAEPYPLSLHLDLTTSALPAKIQTGVANAMRRYRDGDAAGAITSICGIVDSLTSTAYLNNALGDPHSDSYQQRVSKSFSALERDYLASLSGLAPDKANTLWQNHKGSVNQAAYVLGAFRREYSDVHGQQHAPPALVQRALDCAVFIVRSIAPLC